MPNCAVNSCKNRSNTSTLQKDGISFHLFPKNPTLKKEWAKCCFRKQSWVPTRTSTICSRHFEPSQFELDNKRRKLVNDAVPTLFLKYNEAKPQCRTCAMKEQSDPLSLRNNVKKEHSKGLTPTKDLELNSLVIIESLRKTMKRKLANQAKKIKRLQSQNRYFRNKAATLQSVLNKLNSKARLRKESNLILKNIGGPTEELIRRQFTNTIRGITSRKSFSPEFRAFAVTLHKYSPKAYLYLRTIFSTALPHPRTLSKWDDNTSGPEENTQNGQVTNEDDNGEDDVENDEEILEEFLDDNFEENNDYNYEEHCEEKENAWLLVNI